MEKLSEIQMIIARMMPTIANMSLPQATKYISTSCPVAKAAPIIRDITAPA